MSGRDCRQELLESDFHIHAEWMLSGTFIAESAICAVDAAPTFLSRSCGCV